MGAARGKPLWGVPDGGTPNADSARNDEGKVSVWKSSQHCSAMQRFTVEEWTEQCSNQRVPEQHIHEEEELNTTMNHFLSNIRTGRSIQIFLLGVISKLSESKEKLKSGTYLNFTCSCNTSISLRFCFVFVVFFLDAAILCSPWFFFCSPNNETTDGKVIEIEANVMIWTRPPPKPLSPDPLYPKLFPNYPPLLLLFALSLFHSLTPLPLLSLSLWSGH